MSDNNRILVVDNSGIEPESNFSANPTFASILKARMERRTLLRGGVGAAMAGFLGVSLSGCGSDSDDDAAAPNPQPNQPLLGFQAIPAGRDDAIIVPAGYTALAFAAWGTPLTGSYPAYREGQNSGAEQEQQVGQNHDGMHFFPIDVKAGGHSSDEGLLVMNHEYIEQEFLIGGPAVLDENGKRPADDVRKEIAAHGVSVIHIKKGLDGRWNIVQSAFNRRITGATPMQLAGPARGHAKVRTHYSPDGTMTRGTLNNCAHGYTPWGTYLTCEENWAGYFVNKDASRPKEHARFGVSGSRGRYGWELADSAEDAYVRFDATTLGATAADDYRNEPNTFGWIVEIDPFNPDSTPVKRTALGRFAHEGIVFAKAEEGKPLVCYSGDDSQFEYIYKFVSRQPYYASTAGGHLLNDGTLYVAQFNEDGTGNWLVLDVNDATFQSKMQAAVVAGTLDAPFADQGDLLINTRLAADIAGATKMDRPEWGAVDPNTGTVYFTLTNNTRRTDAQVDAANPRANNATGHIIRWDEDSEPAAVTFKWDIFLLSGDVGTATGNTVLTADSHHASPDGLWFDDRGVLWIQTDMSGSQLASGPFGNNQMLACDPNTKEIKRFLVGPPVCEVTGVVMTPDRKTMFVNIQHPGDWSDDGNFQSHWPNGGTAFPRAATVIITKDDGGVIGS